MNYNKYPANRYAFTIQFTCAPANMEKLIAATKDEINKLKTEGITEVDITKFNTEESRQLELQMDDNAFWLSFLSKQYENGDDPLEVLKFPALIKGVTTTSVKSAANLYLNENNFIKLVLIPE